MSAASAVYTLSGWEVRLNIGDAEPAWLSPAEAAALVGTLTAAANEAVRRAAEEAALPLPERILQRLGCCPYHVPSGLAKLIGEDEATVAAALEQLRSEGRVQRWRGLDGFYALAEVPR